MNARATLLGAAVMWLAACNPALPRDNAAKDATLTSDSAASDTTALDTAAPDTAASDTAVTDAANDASLPPDAGPNDADVGADAPDAAGPDVGLPVDVTAGGTWQSQLIKDGWKALPGPDGARLIDFSWAGYHNGAAPLPQPSTGVVDATAKGADPTAKSDSTAGIQAAIDAVAKQGGGVVWLPAGTYRVDGTLTVTTSGTVLRGAGPGKTKLWFTKHTGMGGKAHLRFIGQPKVAFSASAHVSPGSQPGPDTLSTPGLYTMDTDALNKGDEVALSVVVTDGFVADHGMTGTWKAFNGKRVRLWRARFTGAQKNWHGSAMVGMSPPPPKTLRFKLRDKPKLHRITGYLTECGVESLSVGNAVDWDDAWAQDQVHAIELRGVADCWVKDVHSFDPPGPKQEGLMPGAHLQSGGIRVHDSTRVTIEGCHMQKPQHRGGGGNGYLFEIRQSTHVLTKGCVGQQGRHNFIQNWGFGTAGCVWTGILSEGGKAMVSKDVAFAPTAFSEFHHSLAMYNLIEDSVFHDGWAAQNRGSWSSGAGHTATMNTLWNVRGKGVVISRNFGWGFVVGTGPDLQVSTSLSGNGGAGTSPADWVEGKGQAATLAPQSLWASQLAHRLSP